MSQKTPVPGGDLAQLLAALRGAPDSWSRLKLVASGARTLAKLTPQQRGQLLRQLGLQGAEELAEAAAGGDAQTATAMHNALKALEADPRRLQQLSSAIADPNSRRATLVGLGAHVIETVTAPPAAAGGKAPAAKVGAAKGAAPPPPAPAVSTTVPQRSGSGAAQQMKRDLVEAAAALLTGTQPSAPQPSAPPAQPATPQQPSTPSTPPPSLPPTPHPSPTTPQPPAPAPQPPQPSTPVTPPASPPTTPQPVHPVTPPAPMAVPAPMATAAAEPAPTSFSFADTPASSPGTDAVTAPLFATMLPTPALTVIDSVAPPSPHHAEARPAALGTLRDLRRRLAAGEALAADEMTTLFAQELPQGWARRRALSALFAERRPEALDDALALVAQVGSPVDRRWALSDLAASRRWDDGDWDRLVAAASTVGERRRLALRRRRA
ncbi:MAG TPA: hypothetical protein VGS57_18745 [Thermoanaerobaculia bacterium]|nr:hypothetical protein [Thermoanaerobaculia bacterium]